MRESTVYFRKNILLMEKSTANTETNYCVQTRA